MSNYRRLISYIYAYEGGVKGRNIGYAKVEVRGDQCRIHVNVKNVYVGSNDIGVYLLAPGTEIMLGKIFIRGGAGEFRISVQSSNVEDGGQSIDQCYGLTLHDVESAWQCYTTIWEDAVSQSAQIELADVTAERVREREELKSIPVPAVQEAETGQPRFPVSEEIERELDAEERRLAGVAPWGGETPESDEVETVAVEIAADGTDERETEEAETESAGFSSESEMTDRTERPDRGEPLHTQQAESVVQAESAQQAEADFPPEPGDPAQLEALDRMEREESGRNHLWNRLERLYGKVLAFDYDNGCEILSIKPQDIGLLPRETWIYGNNSFLLHGYFNYRHLILAKLDNPQGAPRYLLGVPGHYFSNEKYMASMFGFPHFVLAKKQPEADGRFGYWYTDIRL